MMLQKKICMLGSFAVGKTSLVAKYVHGMFSEQYLTTIGVKIDRKELIVDDQPVTMMLWDIHGEDEFQKVRASYLRGMAGYFLVVDGTRPDTLDTAQHLRDLAVSTVGDVPFVLLLNKSDLADQWRLDNAKLNQLVDEGWSIRKTSAKSGEQVEQAFADLAQKVVH